MEVTQNKGGSPGEVDSFSEDTQRTRTRTEANQKTWVPNTLVSCFPYHICPCTASKLSLTRPQGLGALGVTRGRVFTILIVAHPPDTKCGSNWLAKRSPEFRNVKSRLDFGVNCNVPSVHLTILNALPFR